MTNKSIILVGAFIIAIISLSLASSLVVCDRTSLTLTNSQSTESFTCSNSDSQDIAVVSNGYFSINSNVLESNSSKSFTVTIANNAPNGYSPGLINLGSFYFIPVNVTIPSQQVLQGGCQINPSLVSYTQSIQQGTQIPLPKITFNPIDCNGNLVLTASTVSIQGGIVTPQGQKPISISSVVSDGIILNIDTNGLSSQTYTSALNVNAFNKNFQIPFTIIVTTGTSPASNYSASSLPTCSLSSTTLNLNATYSLICSQIQPDIKVVPNVDSDFIEGTGIDKTSSQITWYFKPKKFGNTLIKADFYYQDYPVGTQFSQEVRVSASGLGVGGTNLQLVFTPSLGLAKPNEDVIIQVIDNKSNSLIDNVELFINAKQLNGSNSFIYKFEQDKNYSVRAKATGYADFVDTLRLSSQPLEIIFNPTSGDTSTMFSINTSVPNATLYLDGVKIDNPYSGSLSMGTHEFLAIKDGFYDTIKNITITNALSALLTTEFKKNKAQLLTLSNNVSWQVNYQADILSPKVERLTGTGNQISFTPDKKGFYTIQSGNQTLSTFELKGWDGKFFGINWYIIAGGLALIVLVFVATSKGKSSTEFPTMAGNLNIQ